MSVRVSTPIAILPIMVLARAQLERLSCEADSLLPGLTKRVPVQTIATTRVPLVMASLNSGFDIPTLCTSLSPNIFQPCYFLLLPCDSSLPTPQ